MSHPNVEIDPDVPVPDWALSERGRERAIAMLNQPWLTSIGAVVSSAERKAVETAELVADRLGLVVDVRPTTGEIDRSSTGFVPHERHEELADRLFAEPDESADGWERAVDAQRRIVDGVSDLVVDAEADAVIVGHGGVGTLLWCHLAGVPIDRSLDQPGQGHHWAFDRLTGELLHPWRPIDEFEV